jgi:2'-5' RNA ligase
MAKVRLFVALELPKVVRAELARLEGALEPRVPNAKWVPAHNLHLTLAFLGWADPERVPDISAAVASAVEGQVDFTSRLAELGAFPSFRRARVLWVGLDDSTGGIAGLASAVSEAVARIGFPQEERPFSAHVTLARLRVPAAVDPGGSVVEQLSVPIERVTLFRSKLGKPSPRYEEIATFPFRRA